LYRPAPEELPDTVSECCELDPPVWSRWRESAWPFAQGVVAAAGWGN